MTYTFFPVPDGVRPNGAVVVGVYRSEATETPPGFKFVLVGYAVVLPDGKVKSFGPNELGKARTYADSVEPEPEPEPEPVLPSPF